MKINSHVVRGHGRGKTLGFPTINLVIPQGVAMSLPRGIFAAKATLKDEIYNAALYYGPASTFGDSENQLEVYLIDAVLVSAQDGDEVEVEVIKHVRPPETFNSAEMLVRKMKEDITKIRAILDAYEKNH